MAELRNQPEQNHSLEYTDCRLSLFSAQKGKCAVSGTVFESADEILCFLKVPEYIGGTERYSNMIMVNIMYSIPIFSEDMQRVRESLNFLRINKKQLDKINKLRQLAHRKIIDNWFWRLIKHIQQYCWWGAVCGESRMHGASRGKRRRLLQSLTYRNRLKNCIIVL